MVKQYRKKPVVIEAVQFTGSNQAELTEFTKDAIHTKFDGTSYVPTLEGDMQVVQGAYVIKGVQGEFYPCKPDIFELTYEAVEEK